MEVGSIVPYPGSVLPEGFLVCDGSAVSRDDYSDLFEIIGTTYGSGDGSTTFNLPNLSGRVALGSSSNYALASAGGEETHTLVDEELAEHSHGIPPHGHENTISAKTPALTHSITQPMYRYNVLNGGLNGATGGGTYNAYNSTTSAAMSRTGNLSVDAHDATACTMSGGVQNCPAFDTDAVGQDQAHDNMMPYLAVMYIIRYEPETKAERMLIFNGCMPVAPSGTYLKGKKR